MKASSCNYCRLTRDDPGETLGSGLPDRTMAASRHRVTSWGASSYGACSGGNPRIWSTRPDDGSAAALCSLLGASSYGAVLDGRGERWSGFILRGVFGGGVRSCLAGRCYAQSCLPAGATHDISSGGFQLRRLEGHGGMVSRCLGGDRLCEMITRRAVALLGTVVVSVACLTRVFASIYTLKMGLRKIAEATSSGAGVLAQFR